MIGLLARSLGGMVALNTDYRVGRLDTASLL